MWNLKYDTDALIYKTEGDSQTSETNLRLPKRKWGKEGEIRSLRLADTKYYM